MKILDDDIGEIRSARLMLRALRLDDVEPLFVLFNNWNVVRLLSSPPWPFERAHAEWFVRSAVERAPGFEEELLAITRDDAFMGAVGVQMRKAGPLQRGPGPRLGYWLGEKFWGQGFMSEAVAAFVRFIFSKVGIETIYSGAFADNAASLRIQEKLGFVRESTSRLFSNPRGADFPHVNTALTRERFRALAS